MKAALIAPFALVSLLSFGAAHAQSSGADAKAKADAQKEMARKNANPNVYKDSNEYKRADAKTKAEVDKRVADQKDLKERYKAGKLTDVEKKGLGTGPDGKLPKPPETKK